MTSDLTPARRHALRVLVGAGAQGRAVKVSTATALETLGIPSVQFRVADWLVDAGLAELDGSVIGLTERGAVLAAEEGLT